MPNADRQRRDQPPAFLPVMIQRLIFCRFQTTFLGSRGLTGKLVAEGMLEQEDRNGETLSDVLYKHGFQGSEEALARAAYTPEQVRG